MDRAALISTLAALLLLSISSPSAQQNPSPSVNSSNQVLNSTDQGAVPADSKPALPSTSPPPANNSVRIPPLPLPVVPSSANSSPATPSSGSSPPPPDDVPIHGSPSKPNGAQMGDGREKEKGDKGVSDADSEEVRNCIKNGRKCGDSLVFCILDAQKDLKSQTIILHNAGKNPLNVIIGNVPGTITLRVNGTAKKELSDTAGDLKVDDNTKMTCPILQRLPPPSMFHDLPAYAASISPVYAAYGIIFIVVLAGGTWICCKLRKRARRVDAGIPYRQLEMGMQTQPSHTADTSNTAEGWDQGWDDDWDDEEAAAGPPHGTTAPSNGTKPGKSSAKDGWEDWDD